MLGLLAPELVHAAPPAHDRFAELDPRPPNLVSIRAITVHNFAGVEFGYRRALSRHLSFGVGLEYVYPSAGYGQIQTLGHRVELAAWIARPWVGPYFAAHLVVGQTFLFTIPELDAVSVGGGAEFGWSWDLPFHINLGVSVGLRRVFVVHRDGPVCSLRHECVYLRDQFQPQFGLSFGYRF